MDNTNAFECHPMEFFMEMERISTIYKHMERTKSTAPKATLPQGGKYCRKTLNFAGINKIPCASKDRIPAEIKYTLWGEEEDMLFNGVTQKTRFSRNFTA